MMLNEMPLRTLVARAGRKQLIQYFDRVSPEHQHWTMAAVEPLQLRQCSSETGRGSNSLERLE